MKNLDQIFENNKQWIQSKLDEDAQYFDKLASGQSPEILYIGCSDSRATAEEIMGMGPGEIFVHRNIANMASNLDLTAMGVINYAVTHLKVDHVIVCGHYGCGGVKAAMQSQDLGILNPYLRNIRDVYRTHKDELNAIEDEEARYKRLVELNVQEQCINVLKTSDVQIAVKNRNITVHGWVFDLESGKLIDLKIDFKSILKDIMEIYHLD
ncbi:MULTISPECIES: carbonic anhydrase [Nonlabens]|uniref:Carbonic anhydrase 2 n=1 Tax=Nonlabens agnitus TaxID=870484 RepID=A0A2S9WXV2_9FLAO|nr:MULTISPECIES: carbonic anhydrase [Nonlabens]KQC34608.1 carbonate dehydratase [Nonlabens sp. YIK11]PRP68297.1 carbonic anhydrase [Nonlabens agnitus]